MRICIIAGEFPPNCGGVGNHVFHLSTRLVQKGHQVSVITRGSWRGTTCEEIKGVRVYRVRFFPSYPFHIQPHSFFVHRVLRSLEKDLDILHLQTPIVPVVHSPLPKVVTSQATLRGFITHLKLLDMFSLVQKTFAWMYVAMDKGVVYSADKLTAASHACVQELREYYGVKEDVEVIGNAVDTSFFMPSQDGPREDFVLYTGSWTTIKGLPDLIKSIPYLGNNYPEVRVVMTGKGPMEGYVKRLIRQLSLEKNFVLPGYVPRQELLRYYQRAALCVLPSFDEGMPTTLLEAMACGAPVVATAVGGIPEVVVEGETGLLVPPGNPEKLAEAISRLLGDSDLRQRMGQKGRERAVKVYDWSILANRMEQIYLEMLNQRPEAAEMMKDEQGGGTAPDG